jgi:FkbM family methyltransferase
MTNNLSKFLFDINQVHPIKTVYDVGANNGDWSKAIKQIVLPHAEMILFEANPIHDIALRRTGFKHLCGTVLSKPGVSELTFYSGGTTTGDSYYKENTEWYNNSTQLTLPCTTLDEVVRNESIPLPDFIKMDTQGSEVDILEGAKFTLPHASLVYLECPIIPYNIGAPGIGEYIECMRQNSFVPIGVFEVHMAENTLLQIDIMFMRNDVKQKLSPNVSIRPLG